MAQKKLNQPPAYTAQDVFKCAVMFDYSARVLINRAERDLLKFRDSLPQEQREMPTINVPFFNSHAALGGTIYSAFATELYFKCLIRLDKNAEPPMGHSLLKLFDEDLERERQIRIRDEYRNQVDKYKSVWKEHSIMPFTKDRDGFDQELFIVSDVFTRWRYPYEISADNPAHLGDASFICFAVLNVVIEGQPSWREHAQILESESIFQTH
jgi:hypothetical protein